MSETIRVIVTKYALSGPLRWLEVEKLRDGAVSYRPPGGFTSYFYEKDFTADPREAVRRAEEMRRKKLASLEKQIAKLRKLKFEVRDV